MNSFVDTWLVKTTAGGTPVPVGSLSILDFRALTKLVSSLRSSLSLSGGINCEIIMSIFPKVTGGRKEGGGKGEEGGREEGEGGGGGGRGRGEEGGREGEGGRE